MPETADPADPRSLALHLLHGVLARGSMLA